MAAIRENLAVNHLAYTIIMTAPIVLSRFNSWVQALFPVKKAERKKVFPLLILKFLISFIYCILANLKDTVLVTYAAAEVIPLVRACIIPPLVIGILLLYTILNNHFKQATIFYGTILVFLILMLLYGFLLYSNQDKVNPHLLAEWLARNTHGKYLHWIALLRHWRHVLLFVIAEFWGKIALMLLFWGFVNQICSIQDAKKFYALFIAAGNIAPIIGGPLIALYSKKYSEPESFTIVVQILISYAAVAALAIMACYWWANRTMVPSIYTKHPPKLTLSLWDSLKQIATSKHLAGIAVMMFSWGLAINITEITGKSYLKEAFPTPAAYQNIIATFHFWIGILSLPLSLFISGSVLRKFGWKTSAKISPITMGILGCCFFLMSYGNHHFHLFHELPQQKSLASYIALFGGIYSVIVKAVKYAFFDQTIQIAYIPLERELKIKGKAAVDLLGSGIGRISSSWIHILLLQFFDTNSIQQVSGILCLILGITALLWYGAVHYVDQQLTLLEKQNQPR